MWRVLVLVFVGVGVGSGVGDVVIAAGVDRVDVGVVVCFRY